MRSFFIVSVFSACLAGCAIFGSSTPPPHDEAYAYHVEDKIPANMRRVVMLPLAVESHSHGCEDHITESLTQAIGSHHLFELLPVDESDVADTALKLTRKNGTYRTGDLITLSRRFGADGILSGTLTQFQAYPQVIIGLRLHLLDCRTGRVPWATDVVLDASSPSIAQDVHNFYDTQMREEDTLWDYEKILLSPRLFGKYAAKRIARTLAHSMKNAEKLDVAGISH